jgi:hypothetical protein
MVGSVLLATGGVMIWRSRRRDHHTADGDIT